MASFSVLPLADASGLDVALQQYCGAIKTRRVSEGEARRLLGLELAMASFSVHASGLDVALQQYCGAIKTRRVSALARVQREGPYT